MSPPLTTRDQTPAKVHHRSATADAAMGLKASNAAAGVKAMTADARAASPVADLAELPQTIIANLLSIAGATTGPASPAAADKGDDAEGAAKGPVFVEDGSRCRGGGGTRGRALSGSTSAPGSGAASTSASDPAVPAARTATGDHSAYSHSVIREE